jgi:hypothetical protein
MSDRQPRKLTRTEIDNLSSPYLKEGKRMDLWEITDVIIDDKALVAHIRMRSHYTSSTDKGGFHLTILSTLEFLSQLMLIFVQSWGGYTEKIKEGWMLESSLSCKRAIRDSEKIEVRMNLVSVKKVKGSILAVTKSKVSDSNNGLFEATLKALLQ